MTTATLRPDATIVAADSLSGAATTHEACNDDSDASHYTMSTALSTVLMTLGTVAMPSGSLTKQARIRARGRGNTAEATMLAFLTSESSTSTAEDVGVSMSFTQDTTLADKSGSYFPVTLTQIQVDLLRANTWITTNAFRVYELYVDLVYVEQPVTVVTAVSPDPYTASTLVPIEWSNTFDTDGGGQTRYEVKVFTDAQYGAGGFDPDTSDAYFTTGEVVSSSTSATVGPLENADTYRAYVRVAQTVNGASHWSDWAFDTFTMDVDTAEIDTVAAVATNASGLLTVTVERDTLTEDWGYVEVQRSIDSGTTWVDVRGATYVDATGDLDTFTVADYEAPNDTNTLYRARATRIVGGLPITGSWVQSSAAKWTSSDCWLKAPNGPSLNMTFAMSARTPYRRDRRVGVFRPLGSRIPVAVTDVRSARSGVLVVETETASEAAALDALLDGSDVLLVQFPPSMDIDDKYVVIVADDETFRSQVADVVWREWQLEYAEVDPPVDPDAGAVSDESGVF